MAQSPSTWSHSFWEFFTPIDTCLMGWCCPCVLFGKTQARLEDPSLKEYSPVNENCLVWCGLSCCNASALIQGKKRQELRRKYNIGNADDSAVEDYLGAFCCRCCGLVQEEKEVLLRQQNGGAAGYQAPQGMDYKP